MTKKIETTTTETTTSTTSAVEAELAKLKAEEEALEASIAEASKGKGKKIKEAKEKGEKAPRGISAELKADYTKARTSYDALVKALEEAGFAIDTYFTGNTANEEVDTFNARVCDDDNTLGARSVRISLWKASHAKAFEGMGAYQMNVQVHAKAGYEAIKDGFDAIGRPFTYGPWHVQYLTDDDIVKVVELVRDLYGSEKKRLSDERAAAAKAKAEAKEEAKKEAKEEKKAPKAPKGPKADK